MAALSSCGVFNSNCDAAAISFSCLPKTASTRSSPCSLDFIRAASNPQRAGGAKQQRAGGAKQQRAGGAKQQRAEYAKYSTLSRRGVVFTSLSTVGIMLLPKSSPAVEVNDKDLREKLLEEIDNLQHIVTKTLDDAKEAVTTNAEKAISSLKFGDDKVAESLTDIKTPTDGTVSEGKLAQN